MSESTPEDDLRRFVAGANDIPSDLRGAWSALGELRSRAEPGSSELRSELDAINADLERYIASTELAKFGHGLPPDDSDLEALVARARALGRYVEHP